MRTPAREVPRGQRRRGRQRPTIPIRYLAFLGALGLDVGRWRAHKGTQRDIGVPGLLVREAPGAADLEGAGQALVAAVVAAAEAGEEGAETRAKRHV